MYFLSKAQNQAMLIWCIIVVSYCSTLINDFIIMTYSCCMQQTGPLLKADRYHCCFCHWNSTQTKQTNVHRSRANSLFNHVFVLYTVHTIVVSVIYHVLPRKNWKVSWLHIVQTCLRGRLPGSDNDQVRSQFSICFPVFLLLKYLKSLLLAMIHLKLASCHQASQVD